MNLSSFQICDEGARPATMALAGGHLPDKTVPVVSAASDGCATSLSRADPDALLQGGDEDFAVTHGPFRTVGAGCFQYGVYGDLYKGVIDGDLNFYFGNQIGYHNLSAVQLLHPLLPVTRNTTDGNPFDVRFYQGFVDFVELDFPYDGCNEFHLYSCVLMLCSSVIY